MIGVREVSERTAANIHIVIRLIFNQAISEGIVDQKHYPYGRGKGKFKISIPDSEKIGLEQDELETLISLDFEVGSREFHARNVWLTSYYLAGARVSDVISLKWNVIRQGRLHYRMGKNNKIDSLKIVNQFQAILDYYKKDKRNNEDFVFPFLKDADISDSEKEYRIKKNAVKRINNALKNVAIAAGFEKKLTTHIARHTFGNISGDKIPIQMLQKLYRHSSVTTTINYQRNFMYKDSDDALEAVVGK